MSRLYEILIDFIRLEGHDWWRLVMTLTAFTGFWWYLTRRFLPAVLANRQARVVEALAAALDAKDSLTFDHVHRTQVYAVGLGKIAGCSADELRALRKGALLHDIGKLGIPDEILRKPGPLTAVEFEVVKSHTLLGAAIIERVGFSVPVLPIVRNHHERWDGSGYPDGLRGREIPLTARILAIVDTFDALREERSYRKALTRQQAIEMLLDGAGTRFDPKLAGLFVTYLPMFEAELRAEKATTQIDGFERVNLNVMAPSAKLAQPAAALDRVAVTVTKLET